MPKAEPKTYTDGFELTDSKLQSIYNEALKWMTQAIGNSKLETFYKVNYKDKTMEYNFTDLKQICSQKNRGQKVIQHIEITLKENASSQSPQIRLEFTRPEKLGQVSMRSDVIGDDDQWVDDTDEQLGFEIGNIKSFSLSVFLYKPFVFAISIILGVFFFLYIAISFFLLIFIATDKNDHNPYPLFLHPLNNVVIVFFIFIIVCSAVYIRIHFFAPYNFCWGDYLVNYNKKCKVGNFLLVTVIVAALISIIAGLIIK